MAADNASFDHLDRPGRLTAFVALRPRTVVNATVASAIVLSWIALALVAIGAAQVVPPPEGLPGDQLLRLLPEMPFPGWAARFVSLCVTPAGIGSGGAGIVFLWGMWMLMALATMLPSAAPMVRTYCEIADTAQAKGDAVAHPLVLVGGYVSVWTAASLVLAGATLGLTAAAKTPVAGLAAPAALTIAGLYQFSGLKEACLKKCRNPFAILFARWSSKPSRIFRLGAEQGGWCLGCCWALMLVMFAVGVMNIFWMALMALFAVVEKQWSGRVPSRLAGAILLVWAALLTVVSR